MRLDKFLVENGLGSRTEVKQLLKNCLNFNFLRQFSTTLLIYLDIFN